MTAVNPQPAVRIACSWSGGKDSCFALMKAVSLGQRPVAIVNMLNENGRMSRSHGLPKRLLQRQADAMSLPLIVTSSSWDEYEKNFTAALRLTRSRHLADAVIFGDIDLDDHRAWEERVCAQAGLTATLPLWQADRRELVGEMIDAGIAATIVSCQDQLGPTFIGRPIDAETVELLDAAGVDVCGENGEFHTVVTDCPLFAEPIKFESAAAVEHDGYWFIDWQQAQV